ncbi:MAG: AAA family ATPase [Firmicutes bacterium]|nr:AAA family ATPase [Bacillota bacterium]
MKKKSIAIGREDFKYIIEENGYYVDKTQLIRELIDSTASVTLFTRPRRFGKTLNLSMIRRFFEDERKVDGSPVDNRYLFDGLAISQCGEEYLRHQQKYPVIKLSMKSAKQPSFDLAYENLKAEIEAEYSRHQYVLKAGVLDEQLRMPFERILACKGEPKDYTRALQTLSACLEKYHGAKTIILIDEYDVPLENAYFRGFYEQMIDFIRSLFESALKTNDSLQRGIITGCLRISRESIFTGLNNLQTDTVLHTAYGNAFGFTENEVKTMLEYYQREDMFGEVKAWYDGYRFGKSEIYNPWSILNYVNDHVHDVAEYPRTYWSNTSSNSIVRNLVRNADAVARRDLETLMEGGTICKQVHEDITYDAIDDSQDNLWNFLYFTGSLKAVAEKQQEDDIYLDLTIPNREVRSIYRNSIQEWFRDEIKAADLSPLRKALEEGDCEALGDFLSDKLMTTISYYDYDETYYHGFLTGLLTGMGGYEVLSNRESGEGRPDIILKELKFRGRAMILELKVTDRIDQMEDCCKQALQQIEEKSYDAALQSEGYRIAAKYGVCFFRKGCMVEKAE